MRPLLLVMLCAGCVASPGASEPIGSEESAVGEPVNGFPSPVERLGLMAINRARSDPETVKGAQSTSYPARPPVIWDEPLAHSSRFQAVNLAMTDTTLMHTSPCTLNTDVATSGCTGDPACACAMPVPAMCSACASVAAVNTCGTAPFTRIGYFTAGTTVKASGEVAAAGYADPMAVVDGWMDEAAGADGHRMNLTDQGITSNTMGYGHAVGGGKNVSCFSTFDFSDSGNINGAVIPKIPTAAVRPPSGAAGSFVFYATWADPTLGTPMSLDVVIDGTCTAMTLELGTDKLNATYKETSTLAAGCHNYFIVGKDSAGTQITYPTTGALTISVGATTCASDYLAQEPAAACATSTSTAVAASSVAVGSTGASTSVGATNTVAATSVGSAASVGATTSAGTGGAGGAPGGTSSATSGVGGANSSSMATGNTAVGNGTTTGTSGNVTSTSATNGGVGGSSIDNPDNGPAAGDNNTHGGCSCSLPAERGSTGSLSGLALAATLAVGARRRRRNRSGR